MRSVMLGCLVASLLWAPGRAQEQTGDLNWRPTVAAPAYIADGPLIRVDEGHGSVQTINGRYAGFATLARADGYRVDAGRGRLDAPGALNDVEVLVISNPASPRDNSGRVSAFDEAEVEAVARWVEGGGSLLLAADHAPHGAAAEALAARFGVGMGKGYLFQIGRDGPTTNLDYPRPALADHPIITGREPSEAVEVVRTFTGQSLMAPAGATILIATDVHARETPDLPTLQRLNVRFEAGEPAAALIAELTRPALPAQGLAFTFGEGRVVVLGEAGMLTAQIVRYPLGEGGELLRFGLNTEGHDGQQFVLNALHWLSRLLPGC
jgi:hypothetical protein